MAACAPLRLCFAGYGSIAAAHAAAFRRLPGIELTWVVGRNLQGTDAFARDWGFGRTTLHLEEALDAPDVDAVVIASPSDLHAPQAGAALAAGKHALIEIPLATSLPDAERVAATARERNLRVQVAHTQRYLPALRELRRRISGGELHPHHLLSRWCFLRRSNVNWMGRRRSWTDNLLWHHGGHVVDAALWLLGGTTPAEAAGVCAQFGPPHPHLGIPLDLDLQFTANGTLVSVSMSYNSTWTRHDYLLIGEEETVEYRDGRLWNAAGECYAPQGEDTSILRQDAEWVQAIREDRDPEVSPEAVLPSLRALAAAEAASQGRIR
jgi:2-hydroxy-4-carboxymuconate semialdehyde hemiacetal dehydrogenase